MGIVDHIGLSLWLVPPSDVSDMLQTVMKLKTPGYQSPSSYPHFHPHVTLATVPSDTPVETLRAAIPADQRAIPVTFKAVEVGDKYFMSIYVVVYQDEFLGVLRDALGNALGEQTIPPKAHVSLFYIDNADAEERQKMADKLTEQGRIVELGEYMVALDCSAEGSEGTDVVDGFNGGEIWIASCDGPVETWSVKDKIRLK